MFAATGHRCTSGGVTMTILFLLPMTPDLRGHLGARASGPQVRWAAETHWRAHHRHRPIILATPYPPQAGAWGCS